MASQPDKSTLTDQQLVKRSQRGDTEAYEELVAPQLQPWRLGAMGFLTLGRQYDNNIHDVIDDRIDTVTRGFLGLTVSCARCHDHKYDAIPIADYYSLYGVFANCESPLEPPLADRPRGLRCAADRCRSRSEPPGRMPEKRPRA